MFRRSNGSMLRSIILLGFVCGLGITGCGVGSQSQQNYESSQLAAFESTPGQYRPFLLGQQLSYTELHEISSAQVSLFGNCKYRLFGFCIIGARQGGEGSDGQPNNRRFKLPDINMKNICQGSVIVAGASGTLFLVSGLATASGVLIVNPISFAAGVTGMKVSSTVAATAAATAWAACRSGEVETEGSAEIDGTTADHA